MSVTPFDPEGLWMKARLFINRAMDDDREFEESAFWACAALELLGKAALSRVSPLLIANPMDDGKSLLIASGGMEDTSNFVSVQAKAVWFRCERLFRPFSESEAKKISAGRNEYLHSAQIGFDAIPERAWWPRYWAQAAVLLSHLDQGIVDLVGPSRAAIVEQHLQTNAQHMQDRLNALLERARSRLHQHDNGTLSAALAAEWDRFIGPGLPHRTEADCPACSDGGWLEGEESIHQIVTYGEVDEYEYSVPDVVVTLEIAAEAFYCPNCHLVIDETLLLAEAGMEESFYVQGDGSDIDYEPEYNNE